MRAQRAGISGVTCSLALALKLDENGLPAWSHYTFKGN